MGRDAHPPAARGTALDWRSVTIPAHVGVPLTDSALDARVYVLDTSVLLSDPRALQRFAEHDVVIPLVVLTELEGKRHHPELGWAARQTLRVLEERRLTHGSLLRPMPANDQGGTLRVEVNHTEMGGFPSARRPRSTATRWWPTRAGRAWSSSTSTARPSTPCSPTTPSSWPTPATCRP